MIVNNAARALRWARKQAGLNITMLAATAGIDPSTVSTAEHQHRTPTLPTFLALANACGFDVVLIKSAGSLSGRRAPRLLRARGQTGGRMSLTLRQRSALAQVRLVQLDAPAHRPPRRLVMWLIAVACAGVWVLILGVVL